MRAIGSWMAAGLVLLVPLTAHAQGVSSSPKPLNAGNVLAALGGGSVDALAGTLRGFVIKALPTPLYEDTRHWGLQKPVREVKWRGKGLHVHPETVDVPKNDGRWWKVRVTAERLADTLVFDLREVRQPEPGRMTFTAFISFDTHVDFDRQVWRSGTRTYSGSIRARLRMRADAALRSDGPAGRERRSSPGGGVPAARIASRVRLR